MSRSFYYEAVRPRRGEYINQSLGLRLAKALDVEIDSEGIELTKGSVEFLRGFRAATTNLDEIDDLLGIIDLLAAGETVRIWAEW